MFRLHCAFLSSFSYFVFSCCVHISCAVPSENKRDQRTIEQVMADSRARKKQKTELNESSQTSADKEHSDAAVH